MRYGQHSTKAHLAKSLKFAIAALQTNIRKLERAGAHPLLIGAREKELFKLQQELAALSRRRRTRR